MDSNDWSQSLYPPTGGKRPSLSPFEGDGRQVKKPRAQPCGSDAAREVPGNGVPFLLNDFPSMHPYYRPRSHWTTSFGDINVYGTPTHNATNCGLGFGDQFETLSGHDINYGDDLGNEFATANACIQSGVDPPWNISSQGPHQNRNNFFSTVLNSEVDLGYQMATSFYDGNPTASQDATRFDEQNDELDSVHSQVCEIPLQGAIESVPDEPSEVCCDYDTCFGVLIATPVSSFAPEDGLNSVTVNLKAYGDVFMLQTKASGTYAGILSDSRMVSTLAGLPLRLDAILLILEGKQVTQPVKSKSRNHASVESARTYTLRITIHGLGRLKETISDLLGGAGLFLQHPSADEVLPGVEYDNPHYLLRPGAQMTRLKYLHHEHEGKAPMQDGREDEINRANLLRLFEAAAADGGVVTIPNTTPSSRLCSSLMSHQLESLAFMLEKEHGYVDQPMFPSLWRRESSNGSQIPRYRHKMTRSLEPRPFPVMGGILADDMGLGKTLSVLALICSSLDSDTTKAFDTESGRRRGTLIVAPKSTIYNWQAQASKHIHERKVKVMTYHGSGRQSLADEFLEADIVITTYETVRSEWADSNGMQPVHSGEWLRIVLDEGKCEQFSTFLYFTNLVAAHHIRNRSKQAFQSVCELRARFRWCLTGTPIHNSLDDYGALLSFVRVHPFEGKPNFMSWIMKPLEQKQECGVRNLQELVRATCLRRTKHQTLSSCKLKLSPRREKIQEVFLHPEDQALYDSVKKLTQKRATKLDKQLKEDLSVKTNDKNIVVLLNSLRLICNHGKQLIPEYLTRMVEQDSKSCSIPQPTVDDRECSVCGGEVDSDNSINRHQNSVCDNCAASEEECSNTNLQVPRAQFGAQETLQSASFGKDRKDRSDKIVCQPSAKVLALLENLKQDNSRNVLSGEKGKSVVFSYWVRMLDLIEVALCEAGIGFRRIDGQTSLEARRTAMLDFNERSECTVMLASIGSAAEGIDLVAAKTVHLIEPNWNPMVESQAVDRVYRIGQTQEVTVIRYVVPNSVETYVRVVQQDKLRVINQTINANNLTQYDADTERRQALEKVFT